MYLDCSLFKQKRKKMEISGYSLSTENYENVCVMFQEITISLDKIKGHSSRNFIESERHEGSSKISFYKLSIGKILF